MRVFSIDHIRVVSIKAFYDNKTSTKTKETTNLLQYESQHFRCKVRLSITAGEADRCWTIGLIQACDYMYLENRYGNIGSSFWEFHPIKCEKYKMVNDSDGRQYPFYSVANSKYEIKRGKVAENSVSLFYEDHFYPTVAWELPYCEDAQLTDIIRKQDFWVWLVAICKAPNYQTPITNSTNNFSNNSATSLNSNSKTNLPTNTSNIDISEFDQIMVLKTIRWRYNLHMSFSPSEPVGSRLDYINDFQENLPLILDLNRTPPFSSLYPPHCNAAQSLIWYPKDVNSTPKLLVPPKQIIVPWDEWVTDMLPESVIKIPKPKDCKFIDSKVNYLDSEVNVHESNSLQSKSNYLLTPNSLIAQHNRNSRRNDNSNFSTTNCFLNLFNRQQLRIKTEA